MRPFSLVASAIACVACASMGVQREVSQLEERLAMLRDAQGSYMSFIWIGEADSERSPRMDAAVERVQECMAPSAAKFEQDTRAVAEDYKWRSLDERYAVAKSFVSGVNQVIARCSRAEGLTGQLMFVVGESQTLNLGEWLDEMYLTSAALRSKYVELEEAQRADMLIAQAISAGLANGLARPYSGDVVAVRPYVRLDGTYVNGYLRTAPNATCADNFSGCRR